MDPKEDKNEGKANGGKPEGTKTETPPEGTKAATAAPKVEHKPGDPFPGPKPQPKQGDTVAYRFGDTAGSELNGKVMPATVTFVHAGHQGRLINILVETPKDPLRIGPVPYRGIDDKPAGNTWHWPAE